MLLVLAGTGAQAQERAAMPGKSQIMTYEVYAGGINAVRAELDVSFPAADRYNLALAARTKGFLGKIVPWQGTFETRGWLQNMNKQPELHKSTAVWRGEEDFKEYYYGKDGKFQKLVTMEPGMAAPASEEIASELVDGTIDALTATLQVMQHVAATGKCEGRNEIFDGKRRFALLFRHRAEEILQSSRYNVYKGPAARCDVEVQPVAGEWHKKPRGWMSIQEQGREKGSLPTVWMAKIDEDGPAIPVKIRVRTDYGVLFMHLVNYDSGNTHIVADNGAVDEETILPATSLKRE